MIWPSFLGLFLGFLVTHELALLRDTPKLILAISALYFGF